MCMQCAGIILRVVAVGRVSSEWVVDWNVWMH